MERDTDSPAWEEALAHTDFLRGLARGLLGDEHLAQDVVQDAWVAALEHPPRERSATGSFFARVVRNLALNARRGERRRFERESGAARPERQEPEGEAFERIELQRALFEHVLALSEPYRETLYQRYYLGRAPGEIAARCELPVKTVKTRLARGLALLRTRMDEGAGGDRERWSAALLPFAFSNGAHIAPAGLGALGGGFAMKKLALSALGIALAITLWVRFGLDGATEVKRAPDVQFHPAEPALAKELPPAQLAVDRQPAVTAGRDPASAAPEPPAMGALVIELTWEADNHPAVDIAVNARCESDPAPREELFLARTDASGVARFAKLFAGEVSIELDRGPQFEAEVIAGETRTVTFSIPTGIEVEGRVVDADGRPVPGAELWVSAGFDPWPSARHAATTVADGRFLLRGLGQETRFGARAPGSQPSASFDPRTLPPNDNGRRGVTIVLGPSGGSVAGRVIDPEGAPIAGAVVLIGERGGHIVETAAGQEAEAAQPVPVHTDATGAFLYPGDLPIGRQPVFVTARGFPVLEAEVEIVAGRRAQLELQLPRPATIEGRLIDVEGEAVSDMRVLAAHEVQGGWYFHMLPPPSTTSDSEGNFRLDWVAPGRRELNANDWKRPRLGRARATVDCRSGELTSCILQLDLGATITGRVVDREGVPLAGWRVRGEPQMMGMVYPRSDSTDEEGRFLLANLGESVFRVTVSAPGEFSLVPRAELPSVESGTSDVELIVAEVERPEGRVRGRLLDASGRVPEDVSLTLWPAGRRAGTFVEVDPETGAFDDGPHAAGEYVLRVMRNGKTVSDSGSFEIPADGSFDIGVLRIGSVGAIELTITGVPEDELAGLRFALDRPQHSTEEPVLDRGRFLFGELAPGTWTLRLRNSPWCVPDAEIEVVSGETAQLKLSAERGREASLRCTVAEGGPTWKELRLEIRDESGQLVRREGPCAPDRLRRGELRFHGLTLADGTYEVEAWTDADQRARDVLVVGNAGRAALLLTLR